MSQVSDPSICDPEDFRDIETAASDAGLQMKRVADYIKGQMRIGSYEQLPKARKQELLDWIEKQKH